MIKKNPILPSIQVTEEEFRAKPAAVVALSRTHESVQITKDGKVVAHILSQKALDDDEEQ